MEAFEKRLIYHTVSALRPTYFFLLDLECLVVCCAANLSKIAFCSSAIGNNYPAERYFVRKKCIST